MFIGEEPGDQEDKAGKPFVGPAGRLLDRALEEAGIDRKRVYLTNVVKHFKWVARGKRRLHEKPNAREVAACRPWLDAEVEVIDPAVLRRILATVHPSSILRAPDAVARREAMGLFVRDLRVVARLLSGMLARTS